MHTNLPSLVKWIGKTPNKPTAKKKAKKYFPVYDHQLKQAKLSPDGEKRRPGR
jgi:hypothetical protein